MKTELLNEYIFGDLLNQYAQIERRRRQRLMEENGTSNAEVQATPLTEEDLRTGFLRLSGYRSSSLKLLAEASSDSQE